MDYEQLNTLRKIVEAVDRGDLVEVLVNRADAEWEPWNGLQWSALSSYRSSPRPIRIKMLGWITDTNLVHRRDSVPPPENAKWLRCPSEDKEVEVGNV